MTSRATNQRAAVRAAIERADRPLSPAEILSLAQRDEPGLGIATVYRTVKLGVAQGWLAAVDLPNGPTRFEPAGKSHHHHFECTACRSVFDVPGCPGRMTQLVPPGYELQDHEIILYGRCADCRQSA